MQTQWWPSIWQRLWLLCAKHCQKGHLCANFQRIQRALRFCWFPAGEMKLVICPTTNLASVTDSQCRAAEYRRWDWGRGQKIRTFLWVLSLALGIQPFLRSCDLVPHFPKQPQCCLQKGATAFSPASTALPFHSFLLHRWGNCWIH